MCATASDITLLSDLEGVNSIFLGGFASATPSTPAWLYSARSNTTTGMMRVVLR